MLKTSYWHLKYIVEVLKTIDFVEISIWSDNGISIQWVKNKNSNISYVRNRVSDISVMNNGYNIFYVNIKSNPADCLTRGVKFKILLNNEL